MMRNADFAHEDEVEWCVERGSDLGGDRDSAARQRQYDRRLVLAGGQC
jgi:hypothetical protein